jgi:hypothetical protein
MPRTVASILVLAAALAVLASAQASRTAVCPARSVGPGALKHGGTTGAGCMLRAYRNGCPATTYVLSSFGVDTVGTLQFQLARRNGVCTIGVTRSFRVVPQKPRVTASGRCAALRQAAVDIVATGCKGTGLSPTLSLTR